MNIYGMIPKDRYITRQELCHLTGWDDRTVRREINELRKHPETVIISSSHKKGYKRPANVEELRICKWESLSRIDEEKAKINVLDQAIRDFEKNRKTEQLMFDFG